MPVQEVALVDGQVNVDDPPGLITVGLAVRVSVGAGDTVTVLELLAEPTVFEHVTV